MMNNKNNLLTLQCETPKIGFRFIPRGMNEI